MCNEAQQANRFLPIFTFGTWGTTTSDVIKLFSPLVEPPHVIKNDTPLTKTEETSIIAA